MTTPRSQSARTVSSEVTVGVDPIVTGIHQHGYRAYEAADLEGNRWTFVQARRGM